MKVEQIETTGQFAAMSREWDALIRASTSDCIFLTHEWLFTWWRHLAEGRRLSILTARDDKKLVGILPLTLRDPQYARMMPHVLEFLGSGVIGSDYLDVIVSRGYEQDVLPAFAEHLTRTNRMLQLGQLRRGSCVSASLAENLRCYGWDVADAKTNICPFIDLKGLDWETFLSGLGASQRYNFKRRLKNLMKSGMRMECVSSPAENRRALDIVIDLHQKRWGTRGASEAFQTDSIVAFHRDFTDLAAERGWLRILVLWVGNTPAAALYGFRYGATFYFYQSGLDPAYSKQSVGLIMMGLAIQAAIDEGVDEYDLLHGDEEYKFHWTNRTRELGRIEIYPPDAPGRLYRHVIHLNRVTRKMARRVLHKGLRR